MKIQYKKNNLKNFGIINLDSNFVPFGIGMDFKKFNFPSNIEQHININDICDSKHILITNRVKTSNDIFDILLTVDILKRFTKKISLYIPYLPYGRQDRITSNYEPFSLKVFADLINNLKFENVITFDVHSDVSKALINNLFVIENYNFVNSILRNKDKDYLIVCPDAGAYKKIYKLCEEIRWKSCCKA